MIQQLKHDVFYVIYNRKYRLLILLTILLTAGLTIYTAVNVTVEEDILLHSFENFRQFFWLLCAYLIADLLSTDYHSQTFKNIIPKSFNRNNYYLSKIMVATILGVFILVTHVITSWIVIGSVAAGIELNYFNFPYFFLGAVLSLFLFSALLSFVITLFGKETVTISTALGLVILQILVEGFDPAISAHFPTMYVVSLDNLVSESMLTALISIGSYIICTLLLFIGTIKIFHKQDLFI
ncbi:hypothetical protein [Oceanobacillus jeddahense]|uniref:ABC transporter permease n=1 Tax=Oceanobacillus jeddahense TaxID=1462527 RepID=A0ABY5JLP9_9BACI|nr:hypothetical protein [Oceanobacillus jeddahense]UUI01229.1 hypothetical protein NP439_14295 [Oceanobacillus jeddahense]